MSDLKTEEKIFPEIGDICREADRLKEMALSGQPPMVLRRQVDVISGEIARLESARRDATQQFLAASKKG